MSECLRKHSRFNFMLIFIAFATRDIDREETGIFSAGSRPSKISSIRRGICCLIAQGKPLNPEPISYHYATHDIDKERPRIFPAVCQVTLRNQMPNATEVPRLSRSCEEAISNCRLRHCYGPIQPQGAVTAWPKCANALNVEPVGQSNFSECISFIELDATTRSLSASLSDRKVKRMTDLVIVLVLTIELHGYISDLPPTLFALPPFGSPSATSLQPN